MIQGAYATSTDPFFGSLCSRLAYDYSTECYLRQSVAHEGSLSCSSLEWDGPRNYDPMVFHEWERLLDSPIDLPTNPSMSTVVEVQGRKGNIYDDAG